MTTPEAGPDLRPRRLAPNLVDHFYAGGARIAALRGVRVTSNHQPEEWLGATVGRVGDAADDNVANSGHQALVGLARTEDGDLVLDLVAADPVAWRGAGPALPLADGDTGVLLKLLDAGQRLPVHVHPDRAFAASHLGCPYGKTESWFVLDADPDAVVHLGWIEDVAPADLARAVEVQDGEWMLDRMHRIPVRPGDGILVPAGQVHAIGAGVLIAEAQEPTDLSVLLEWSVTTSGPDDAHLGLGMGLALTSVSHRALSPDAVAALIRRTPTASPGLASLLPDAADPFFRLGQAVAPATVPDGFAVVLVIDGSGHLVSEGAGTGAGVPLAQGEAWVVPAAAAPWRLEGSVTALVARPGGGWPGTVQEAR